VEELMKDILLAALLVALDSGTYMYVEIGSESVVK
jgi:hypothetical protein